MEGLIVLLVLAAVGLWLIGGLYRKYRRWAQHRKVHQIFHIALSVAALKHYQSLAHNEGMSVSAYCSIVLERHAIDKIRQAKVSGGASPQKHSPRHSQGERDQYESYQVRE